MFRKSDYENHPLFEKLRTIKRDLTKLYIEVQGEMKSFNESLKDKDQTLLGDNIHNLADIGWILREVNRVADDLRKESLARAELAGKFISIQVIEEALQDPEKDLAVRTKHCSATPSNKMIPKIPSKGTDEYYILLRHMGVKEEFIDNALLQPHFRRMQDYMTEAMEVGRKLPEGVFLGYVPSNRCEFRTYKPKVKSND